ncbi:response regulator transcription factor [Nisaea acidiphila]|uniref:Response regulator transcription factor n=1 Tax=Nisaea acidiphila TaxID=1862145 RepID=A0A9J7ASW5_9PROT|nr:response regulator transcription factor [Nisaea acidiphila]UUX49954.1 response regulator transcription factor [Nisaea acidiphila]
MARILLIDDDPDFCDLLSTYLSSQGFEVDTLHGGKEALERLADPDADRPDAVCLDLMMPAPNGLDVLTRLRTSENWIPLLILTANTDETERIVSLEVGADDFVAKTASPRELAARLKALVRRARPDMSERQNDSEKPVRIEELMLVPSERRADLDGTSVSLTSTEFGVLHYLMRHAGTAIRKEDLSVAALGRSLSPYDRALDVHVSHIRKKLSVHPNWQDRIQAVRGVGYQLLVSG